MPFAHALTNSIGGSWTYVSPSLQCAAAQHPLLSGPDNLGIRSQPPLRRATALHFTEAIGVELISKPAGTHLPRRRMPERMDDPALPPAVHRAALNGLARINRFSRTAAALWRALRDQAADAARAGGALRVLDVASGGADVSLDLWRRSNAAGMPMELTACDVSATALAVAQVRAAAMGAALRCVQLDLLSAPAERELRAAASGFVPAPGHAEPPFDVVLCTLFLHHLAAPQAIALLRLMGRLAARCVLVSDLRRSRIGVALAWAGTRLLSRSAVVRYDGVVSARAAFSMAELRKLAQAAGLAGARVRAAWPQRLLLRWDRVA